MLSAFFSNRLVSLVSILLSVLFVPLATIACAQNFAGGGGGPGAGMETTQLPFKIVIMLGPDYDYSQKPFVDAPKLMKVFQRGDAGSIRPTLNSISVDVDMAVPGEDAVTVIATHARDISDAELSKLKKSVQLNALRFGLNHVEMKPKTAGADSAQNVIWLRVPYNDSESFAAQVAELSQIATALAASSGFGPLETRQARMDLYFSRRGRRQDSFGFNPFGGPLKASADPFGTDTFAQPSKARSEPVGAEPFGEPSKTPADPFGAAPATDPAKVDPFGTVDAPAGLEPTVADPFGGDSPNPFGGRQKTSQFQSPSSLNGGDETMSDEITAREIERHRELQATIKGKIEQLKQTVAQKTGESLWSFRELARTIVEADFDAQLKLQRLEVAQMSRRLVQLQKKLDQRTQPDVRQKTIRNRIESILQGEKANSHP